MNMSTTDMPDPDSIKMFVGQIPKSWSENDVRIHFEEFGRIYLINVLRDKMTKQSRGCCFITFYTRKAALDAQNACHNLKTLPGMNHPVQMKPADNENRSERKIFIGMLSKKLTENDLRNMFCRFGLIEECSILRDGNNGISRGCGFITFSSKACAHNAIRTMHQSTIMEGCSSPVVVKLADTRKEKTSSSCSVSVSTTPTGIQPTVTINGFGDSSQKNPSYITLLQLLQQQAGNLVPQGISGLTPLGNLGNIQQAPSADLTALTLLAGLSGNNCLGIGNATTSCGNGNNSNMGLMSSTCQGAFSLPGGVMNALSQVSNNVVKQQTQIEGPEGSNLFIYHLPQEFSDSDLIQAFSSFGNIISAKVFIDRTTNLSKCFGFVSYDNAMSASMAIHAMNGFQVGPKRLKVQLKRQKEKPY